MRRGIAVNANVGRPIPAELTHYYGLWRKIANFVGDGPYDEADWEDDRLYFRSDYSEKLKEWPEWAEYGDWAAWFISPSPEGYFCVIRSLVHERSTQRSESLEAVFSSFENAGKYIVMRIGDGVRTSLRLKSLFLRWEARGINPHIKVEPPTRVAIELFNQKSPSRIEDYFEKHLKTSRLKDDPNVFGITLYYEQPSMEVLALSFEELTTALLDGMPESITSKIPAWRQ
jgi:hypothetical protein